MLERVVRRVQKAKSIDRVVVATTDQPSDDKVAELAERLGVHVTRGSEDDVLDRFQLAAKETGAATIVRVSADSPFVDPEVTDMIVDAYLAADVDYASNKLDPSFPLGLDVEAFSRAALDTVSKEASKPYERAHVTLRIYSEPGQFKLLPVTTTPNRHDWRWTVDTEEDLRFARAVYSRLHASNDFSWRDVADLIERDRALAEINAHLRPKDVTAG